ncbi:neprilysin-3-like [Amblyomma americanum]
MPVHPPGAPGSYPETGETTTGGRDLAPHHDASFRNPQQPQLTSDSGQHSSSEGSDWSSLILTLPYESCTCCLTVVFVAFMVVIFMVGVALTLSGPGPRVSQRVPRAGGDNQTCAKRHCSWLARTLSDFSPDSAPCDDFYRHVCRTKNGHWLSRTSHMDFDVNSAVTRLLRRSLLKSKKGTAVHKAASLYAACTNILRHDRSEIGDLRSFMRTAGLDLVSMGDKGQRNAVDIMCALFFRYGINTVLFFMMHDLISVNGKKLVSVGFNKNFEAWIVKRAQLVRTSKITHYYVHYVGAYHDSSNNDTWDALSMVSEADNVASSLLATHRRRRDETYAQLKVRQLSRFTPKTVSRQEWEEAVTAHSRSEYAANDTLYVKPSALKFLNALLSRLNHHGVKCEMAWCLLRNYGPYADRRLISSVAAHNQTCLERVAAVMGPALYGAFIFRAVPPKAIQAATAMALDVRRQAEIDIARATWLGAKAKHHALKKIQGISFHIGFQKQMQTMEDLDSYYLNFPSAPAHFLLNWLRASKLARAKRLGNRDILLPHRGFPTAAYVGQSNTVFISADLLRPPMFVVGGPVSFNYGGLGQIIAHEIVHAFLVSAKESDQKWGSASTGHGKALAEKMLCLKQSHGEALEGAVPSSRHNSDSENVADLAGAALAFRAYANMKGRNATLARGPSEEQEQLFFTGLCLKHCEREENDASLFTPSPLRCIVQLKNMHQFATTFRCHADDAMNTAAKCSVF